MKSNFNKNRVISDDETTDRFGFNKTSYHIALITLAILFFVQLIILIILNLNMQSIMQMVDELAIRANRVETYSPFISSFILPPFSRRVFI
jgi:hypothetical protein